MNDSTQSPQNDQPVYMNPLDRVAFNLKTAIESYTNTHNLNVTVHIMPQVRHGHFRYAISRESDTLCYGALDPMPLEMPPDRAYEQWFAHQVRRVTTNMQASIAEADRE